MSEFYGIGDEREPVAAIHRAIELGVTFLDAAGVYVAPGDEFVRVVLYTGNNSEMSFGYSTLCSDTTGGFTVIRDVPKTLVYRICRSIDERRKGR